MWLSEGFATYFTQLYTEQFDGRDAFVARAAAPTSASSCRRSQAPGPARHPSQPRGHEQGAEPLRLPEGRWVLHMLRGVIGTEKFWAGIRDYYRRYRNCNASTDDFRQVMEQAAGTDLAWFFDQWLKRPGMPKLSGALAI